MSALGGSGTGIPCAATACKRNAAARLKKLNDSTNLVVNEFFMMTLDGVLLPIRVPIRKGVGTIGAEK